MILVLVLLAFAFFIGLVMELYKKLIRKNKASDVENRLVAFGLSAVFGLISFLVLDNTAFPDEFKATPLLIVVFTVSIYILQLPACMQVWKPLLKKAVEKKAQQ
jgi:heme/copper-type cytochrome/quinol oxidase subunit 4